MLSYIEYHIFRTESSTFPSDLDSPNKDMCCNICADANVPLIVPRCNYADHALCKDCIVRLLRAGSNTCQFCKGSLCNLDSFQQFVLKQKRLKLAAIKSRNDFVKMIKDNDHVGLFVTWCEKSIIDAAFHSSRVGRYVEEIKKIFEHSEGPIIVDLFNVLVFYSRVVKGCQLAAYQIPVPSTTLVVVDEQEGLLIADTQATNPAAAHKTRQQRQQILASAAKPKEIRLFNDHYTTNPGNISKDLIFEILTGMYDDLQIEQEEIPEIEPFPEINVECSVDGGNVTVTVAGPTPEIDDTLARSIASVIARVIKEVCLNQQKKQEDVDNQDVSNAAGSPECSTPLRRKLLRFSRLLQLCLFLGIWCIVYWLLCLVDGHHRMQVLASLHKHPLALIDWFMTVHLWLVLEKQTLLCN